MDFPRTFPFILCHGIAPMDFIFAAMLKTYKSHDLDFLSYFVSIRSFLLDSGFIVENARVSFVGTTEQRALDLKKTIENVIKKYNCKKVHLICHSMGGLDGFFFL
jgi:triacylglycerol esterase/lipase EstA (alpha/beta hydrolase family)